METLRTLDGLVDGYLPDCKYVSRDLAARLSGAEDYPDVVFPALEEMMRQTGAVRLDDKGIALSGTIIRHLVLPGHTNESRLVLERLAAYKDTAWISLLFQYTPMGALSEHKELQRYLTARECDKVFAFMEELGITEGYVQDRASKGTAFIPIFDLTGV